MTQRFKTEIAALDRIARDLDPSRMTAGQINKALDRLERKSSALNQKFIDAGRGHERPSETFKLTDPLSRAYHVDAKARESLRVEIARRYGPGAPTRLPRGFGPIGSLR